MELQHYSDIKIGHYYLHDGMQGVAMPTARGIEVSSGSDGYYPIDVLNWGGVISEVKLLTALDKTK